MSALRALGTQPNSLRSISYFNELLAEVLAGKQADEGGRRVFESFDDRFRVFQFALREPLGQRADAFRKPGCVVSDNEPLHQSAIDQKVRLRPWANVKLVETVN